MSFLLMLFGAGYYFFYGCGVLGTLLIHFVIDPLFFDIDIAKRRAVRKQNRATRKRWMSGLLRDERQEFEARENKVAHIVWILSWANTISWVFGSRMARLFWWAVDAESYREFFDREMLGANFKRGDRSCNECSLEVLGSWEYAIINSDPNEYDKWIPAWRPPLNWVGRSVVDRVIVRPPWEEELHKYGAWELYQTRPDLALKQVEERKADKAKRDAESAESAKWERIRRNVRELEIKTDLINGTFDWNNVRDFDWGDKDSHYYWVWEQDFKEGKYESEIPYAPKVVPVNDKKKTVRFKLPDGVMYIREDRL